MSIEKETGMPAAALNDKINFYTVRGHTAERVNVGLLLESIVGIE